MRRLIFVGLLAAFALFSGAAMPVVAADTTPAASATSPENLEKLVETLENEERRKAMVRDLKSLIAAQKRQESAAATGFGARLMADLTARLAIVSEQLVAAAGLIFEVPVAYDTVREGLKDPDTRAMWASVLIKLLIVLVAGIVAELLARAALSRPRRAVETRESDSVWITAMLLLFRTVLDIVPIAVFGAAAYGGLTLYGPEAEGQVVAVALINASVLARAVVAVARMCFAPKVSGLRLFPIGDETANYLFLWIKRLTNLIAYGYFLVQSSGLLGAPIEATNTLQKLLGLLTALLLVMIVLQNRTDIANWIRGEGGGALPILRRRFADLWHVLAIVYLAASFTVWALEIEGGFEFVLRASVLSIVIIVVGRLLELLLRNLVARAFTLGQELNARLPGLEARANRYLPVIQSIGRGVLYLILLLAVLEAWGLNVFSWFASEEGLYVIGRIVLIVLIVSLSLVAWEVVSALIERYLAATDADGNAVARSQRAKTLLPLLRNVFTVVLVVMVTMTVLSELGLNIAPLLAGAGVVGLAIGFGAQTLVKDVITGVFILLEDTISAGDVVEVAGHSGVVEGVTIRTIRLRDVSGTVHTVPFSDVTSVKNLTRDFSFAFLEIGVAYREDIDEVIEVIEQLGAELRADPEFADRILEDIQVQGLDRFDDSAIVIRARIKTKPLQQWGIRRAFNLRMKRRFDELGIEIPFPHQTIYFGEDKAGNAPSAPVRLVDAREKTKDPVPAAAPETASQTPVGGDTAGEDQMGGDGI